MADKKLKKVSKKKILFIELDEEITAIFERVEPLPYKEIYLVVPQRAVLLQSIVNLKILKQKLREIDKAMAIITNDTNGMNLAHQAEIRVFDHWNIESGGIGKEHKADGDALLEPVRATSNEVEDSSPSRLPQKKSSIFEVVRNLKAKDKGFSLKSYLRDKKKNQLQRESWKMYLPGGYRRFIGGLLLSSVAIFFVIAYVALPGATLYIEPASSVITKGVNISLSRNPSDARELRSYAMTTEIELTITHHASGIISDGADAKGELTIINTANKEWPLIARTRFQTEEGLVFRITDFVTVPAGSGETPGTLTVSVVADPIDAGGVPTGSRGNVEPTKFFLPGLSESSRESIFAESYDAFIGGETVVSAQVLEDDLIAASEKLIAQLQEKALSSLRKETLSASNTEGVTLMLLEDSDVLEYGDADFSLPYGLVGQEAETFEVTGTMSLSGVAYDQDALLSILKTEIVTAETPGKQLVRVNEESVNIQVLEFDNVRLEYKFTADIQGIEEFRIESDLEGESGLSKKIKEHIAGKNITDAEQYVQNLEEVNKVEIKIWPSWSPTIPSLPENIHIKSTSEGEVVELEE